MQRAMMPGRWTLITTEVPSRSFAVWTCAIDADASCFGSMSIEVRGLLGAELLVERALDVLERERLHAIEDLLELLDVGVGEHARRRRDDLAELDERRPHVLAPHAAAASGASASE